MYKVLSPRCVGHDVRLNYSAPLAEKYGFEGIWFDIDKDSVLPLEETKRLLEKHNLKAAGFGLPVDFRRDDETFRLDMKKLYGYAEYARACGMKRCVTWIAPASDELSYEDNFKMHIKRLKEIANVLERFDINLGLEFLGPPKLRRGKKYEFIYNLDQMLELCRAIDEENVGLLLDVWHWDMAEQVSEDFNKIVDESVVVCVHIMDAPANVPRDEQEDLIRALPGSTGVLRIKEFLQGIRSMNYTGPILAEPFEKELSKMSFENAVKVTKQSIDKVCLL